MPNLSLFEIAFKCHDMCGRPEFAGMKREPTLLSEGSVLKVLLGFGLVGLPLLHMQSAKAQISFLLKAINATTELLEPLTLLLSCILYLFNLSRGSEPSGKVTNLYVTKDYLDVWSLKPNSPEQRQDVRVIDICTIFFVTPLVTKLLNVKLS